MGEMNATRRRDCFISYTRHGADLAAALRIEEALKSSAMTSWRDIHQISGGDKFFDEIVLALQASRTVVSIISEESLKSDWVKGEIFAARSFDKLIPTILGSLRLEALPFGIAANYQCIRADDLDGIVSAVRKHRKDQNTEHFLRLPPAPKNHATVHVLASLAQWPSDSVDCIAWQQRAQIADRFFSKRRKPAIRVAYQRFCTPTEIVQGLYDLRGALVQHSGSREEWEALADLARPFEPTLALAALEHAGLSRDAIDKWLQGRSLDVLQQERLASPKNYEQALSELSAKAPPRTISSNAGAPLLTHPPTVHADHRELADLTEAVDASDSLTSPVIVKPKRTLALGLLLSVVGVAALGAALVHLDRPADGPLEATRLPPVAAQAQAPILRYCNEHRVCRFPPGHSFARVARDCYQDDRLWPLIWAENRSKFGERDPQRVYSGEEFVLPTVPPCEAAR